VTSTSKWCLLITQYLAQISLKCVSIFTSQLLWLWAILWMPQSLPVMRIYIYFLSLIWIIIFCLCMLSCYAVIFARWQHIIHSCNCRQLEGFGECCKLPAESGAKPTQPKLNLVHPRIIMWHHSGGNKFNDFAVYQMTKFHRVQSIKNHITRSCRCTCLDTLWGSDHRGVSWEIRRSGGKIVPRNGLYVSPHLLWPPLKWPHFIWTGSCAMEQYTGISG